MERKRIELEKYGWSVDVLYDAGPEDCAMIAAAMYAAGATRAHVRSALDNASRSRKDFGVTYSDTGARTSVMVIGRSSSAEQFASTWGHEVHHLANHIADCIGYDVRSEQTAYVAGEIALAMCSDASRRICHECRKNKH